ncbi:Defensin-like protein 2 [Triticum urartu]|uniref:Defensin-like protein 2 n=1 Tax=Triticum urartu TaxID=4572 RepID=M7YZR7_TRIUA|nr:defensin Tk-AMP-D1.1-like [Triticum urartu]EMS53152.1 Defensin-like protein 2 [Triticum urartu]
MESSHKLFQAIAILLLLLVATEVVPAQARECETERERFNGLCFVSANCAGVCGAEGFTGGKCSGLKRSCMCTKEC